MSDQSQGLGWWLASDGKWYPPESHPTAAAPPPPGAQPADLATERPGLPARAWRKYRVWPLWAQIVAALVMLGVVAAPFGSSEDTKKVSLTQSGSEEASAETTTVEAPTTTEEPTTTTTEAPTTTVAPTTTTAPPPPPTTTPPPPDPFAGETVSQRNARGKAAEYLDIMSFSRSGLIGQLEYEGFTQDDAAYGIDALNVDWNEQAANKAAEYLDMMSFSRSGLIGQLLYEGFTQSQAEYGVSTTGL